MVLFAMIVLDELSDRRPEMPLADRNQPVQTLCCDRPHESFHVGVGIRAGMGVATTRTPASAKIWRTSASRSSRRLSNLLEVREVMGPLARQELCDPVDR